MGLPERVNARLGRAGPPARRDGQPKASLSLDEYASWFNYGGLQYPLMQTTYNSLDQERIAWTADWAARTSGPVFALIRARQEVFSQIRFAWTRFTGAQPGDLFGTAQLAPLEKPWPGGTTSDLLARMEWDVSAAGNAYIRRKGSTLHRLNPAWVIIVLGSQEDAENPWAAADTTVAGYLYVPQGGKEQMRFFYPQQIAHYAPIPDPDMHFLGMSWITPVLRDLQADQAAVEHKYKFFENAATPNIAIKFDPGVTIDTVKQFKELAEEEHRGAFNAWKTLYLGGGADVTPVGMSFKEMDYAVVQGRAESRLAAAAGVPPSWVGFEEGLQGSSLNAGNFDSARRRFSDGTMVALWSNAAASLEPILDRPVDAQGRPLGQVSLWYDTRIPFMRQDAGDQASIQLQQAQTIGTLVKDGFTAESAVKAVLNSDMGLLQHTGLVSVQLLPPGEMIDQGAGQPPRPPEEAPPADAPAPPVPAAANGHHKRLPV